MKKSEAVVKMIQQGILARPKFWSKGFIQYRAEDEKIVDEMGNDLDINKVLIDDWVQVKNPRYAQEIGYIQKDEQFTIKNVKFEQSEDAIPVEIMLVELV